MLTFRSAVTSDLNQIATLATATKMDDPLYLSLFRRCFSNQARYFDFIVRLQFVKIHDALQRDYCLVGTLNQQIITTVIFTPNQNPATTIGQYLRAGAFSLFPELLRPRTFMTLKQLSQQSQPDTAQDNWTIRLFATNPMYRSQHIGRQMIQSVLIPELRKLHAKTVLTTSHTKSSSAWYQRLHFSVASHTKLKIPQCAVDCWKLALPLGVK